MKKLYSENDLKIMKIADISIIPNQDRLEEIIAFAKNYGIKRIGIANCISMQREAEILYNYLSNDFEVYTVGCKTGKIPNKEFLGEDAKGISCNPAEQAQYLSDNNTELNIVMGLCVGHEILFLKKSNALTTTLIAKDRKHKNNSFCIFKDLSEKM